MGRLLSLDGHQLQKECKAIPAHLRKAGSFAFEGACVKNARAKVAAVVVLFQAWLSNAGASRLSVEAAWQEVRREREPKRFNVEPNS